MSESVKLIDLNPGFYNYGGEGITHSKTGKRIPLRQGVGILFDCPCGCNERVGIPFSNPIDGGDAVQTNGWKRKNDTHENLTLHPSIRRLGKCKWHGFLTNGEFKSV